MAGGCFTDVVLHSSPNYHQEIATGSRLLPKDVMAAWGAVIFLFPRSCQSLLAVNCGAVIVGTE